MSHRVAVIWFLLSVTAASQTMYWADNGTDSIRRASTAGTGTQDLVTTGLVCPVDIEIDVAAGKIYWVDGSFGKIQRANLDGTSVEDLVTTGLITPSGIALDLVAGKLYWSDLGTDRIRRSNLDGTSIEDLVTTGLSVPDGIDVDPMGGKMYWCDRGTERVQRANLDGSNVENLVTVGQQEPDDIKLDLISGKMYWSDYMAQRIQRANLDGSNVETIVTGVGFPRGLALDLDGCKIYWGDPWENRIRRRDLDGLSPVEDISPPGVSEPLGMALDIPMTCCFRSPTIGALASGVLVVDLSGVDRGGGPVDVLIEISTSSGVTWSLPTVAASSPLPNPAPGLATPLVGYELHVDTVADGLGISFLEFPLIRATLTRAPASATCQVQFAIDNTACPLCGDCNLTTTGPDILDALVAAQLGAAIFSPSPGQTLCCDVDSSGGITILDALRIAQLAVGMAVTLDCP